MFKQFCRHVYKIKALLTLGLWLVSVSPLRLSLFFLGQGGGEVIVREREEERERVLSWKERRGNYLAVRLDFVVLGLRPIPVGWGGIHRWILSALFA